MNNNKPLIRYTNDILAWEYDQRQPSPLPGELNWYLAYAKEVGGPILELACGSGRLTIPLAHAGFEVDGVDYSAAMLRRLTQRLQGFDDTVRNRVRTYCADMLIYSPNRYHPIIIIPNNSIQYLERTDRIASLFRRVAEWLLPGGIFLFTIRRFRLGDYPQGKRIVDWLDQPILDEATGITVGSKLLAIVESETRRIVMHRTYEIRHADGRSDIIEFTSYAPIIHVNECIALIEDAGFKVQVTSAYGLPDDGVSVEVCFECRK